jgi:hypothetical protein
LWCTCGGGGKGGGWGARCLWPWPCGTWRDVWGGGGRCRRRPARRPERSPAPALPAHSSGLALAGPAPQAPGGRKQSSARQGLFWGGAADARRRARRAATRARAAAHQDGGCKGVGQRVLGGVGAVDHGGVGGERQVAKAAHHVDRRVAVHDGVAAAGGACVGGGRGGVRALGIWREGGALRRSGPWCGGQRRWRIDVALWGRALTKPPPPPHTDTLPPPPSPLWIHTARRREPHLPWRGF